MQRVETGGWTPLPPLSCFMMHWQHAWDHPVNWEHLHWELDRSQLG